MNNEQKNLIKLTIIFLCLAGVLPYLIYLIVTSTSSHDYQPDAVSARTRALGADFEDVQYFSLDNSEALRKAQAASYSQLANQLLMQHYETHKNLERRAYIDGDVSSDKDIVKFRIGFLPSNTKYDVTINNKKDSSRSFTLEMKELK